VTTFFFIRHGNAYDAKGEQTPTSHLNEEGKTQAEYLGKALQGTSIDVILCSPYTRAQETCQIASSGCGVECRTIEGLKEIGSNDWPAPTELFVNEKVISEFKQSVEQVKNTYNKLVTDYHEKRVFVFTHGNWIRVLLSTILNLDILALQHFHINFATVTTITIDDQGGTYISSVSADYAKIAKKLLEWLL